MQPANRQPRIIGVQSAQQSPAASAAQPEPMQRLAQSSRGWMLVFMVPAIVLMFLSLGGGLSTNALLVVKFLILVLVLAAGWFARAENTAKTAVWAANQQSVSLNAREANSHTDQHVPLADGQGLAVQGPQTRKWIWHVKMSKKIMFGLLVAIFAATGYIGYIVKFGDTSSREHQATAAAFLIVYLAYAVIAAVLYQFGAVMMHYRAFLREYIARRPGTKHADALAAFGAINHSQS
jgi:hypothetical protein